MIEITFNESAAGALEYLKLNDVEALCLMLDLGDISDMDTGMAGRKKLLDELFAKYTDVPETIWQTSRRALSRLTQAKAAQEPIRLWTCAGNPAELCGLYFVCHWMADCDAPLYLVRFPEEIEKEDGLVSYGDTGAIIPEELDRYAQYEKPITKMQRAAYASMWKILVQQNAPLRAVINGSLMGLHADFYDFALRVNILEGECSIAELIGRAMGAVRGIGDQWLYLRVLAMLRSGELEEVSGPTDGHHYSATVRRKG